MTNTLKEEILSFLQEYNQTWLRNDIPGLKTFFHENIVILNSKMEILGSGLDACIKSYEDFLSQGTIHEFTVEKNHVEDLGQNVMLITGYVMDYEIGGKRYKENGKEMLVLSKQSGDWKIVIRMVKTH